MSELKAATKELAEKLHNELKFDKETKTIPDNSFYEKHLPEGLTMEVVEKVDGYNTTFIAASAHAVGKVAIEHMAKEKSLDQVSAEFQMGKKNTISHVVHRERSFTNPADPSKPITKMGDVSSVYTVHAGRNQGELKKVRNELHELAMSKLK